MAELDHAAAILRNAATGFPTYEMPRAFATFSRWLQSGPRRFFEMFRVKRGLRPAHI